MTDTLHGLTRGCSSLHLAHAKIRHHAGGDLAVWTSASQDIISAPGKWHMEQLQQQAFPVQMTISRAERIKACLMMQARGV